MLEIQCRHREKRLERATCWAFQYRAKHGECGRVRDHVENNRRGCFLIGERGLFNILIAAEHTKFFGSEEDEVDGAIKLEWRYGLCQH